jgi:hypothetical protein
LTYDEVYGWVHVGSDENNCRNPMPRRVIRGR